MGQVFRKSRNSYCDHSNVSPPSESRSIINLPPSDEIRKIFYELIFMSGSVFLCFLPLVLGMGNKFDNNTEWVDIYQRSKSSEFKYSLVAAMTSAVIFLVDLFVDVMKNTDIDRKNLISRGRLFLVLLVSSGILFFNFIQFENRNLLPSILIARELIFVLEALNFLNANGIGTLILDNRVVYAVQFHYVLYVYLRCFRPFVSDFTAQNVMYGDCMDFILNQWNPLFFRTFCIYLLAANDIQKLQTVTEISESCNIAVDILNEILIMDKIESNSLSLDTEEVNALSFVYEAMKPYFLHARQTDINLTLMTSKEMVNDTLKVVLDKNKMKQVVRHFVSNALKYTPKGGNVTVEISIEEEKHTPCRAHDTHGSVKLSPRAVSGMISSPRTSSRGGRPHFADVRQFSIAALEANESDSFRSPINHLMNGPTATATTAAATAATNSASLKSPLITNGNINGSASVGNKSFYNFRVNTNDEDDDHNSSSNDNNNMFAMPKRPPTSFLGTPSRTRQMSNTTTNTTTTNINSSNPLTTTTSSLGYSDKGKDVDVSEEEQRKVLFKSRISSLSPTDNNNNKKISYTFRVDTSTTTNNNNNINNMNINDEDNDVIPTQLPKKPIKFLGTPVRKPLARTLSPATFNGTGLGIGSSSGNGNGSGSAAGASGGGLQRKISTTDPREVSIPARKLSISGAPPNLQAMIASGLNRSLRIIPADFEFPSPANAGGSRYPEATSYFLRIRVIDSGIGISKENQEKLFKDTLQLDADAMKNGMGSGLGMFISKGIVNLHNGKIGVHSEGLGHGSQFYVDIPISIPTGVSLKIGRSAVTTLIAGGVDGKQIQQQHQHHLSFSHSHSGLGIETTSNTITTINNNINNNNGILSDLQLKNSQRNYSHSHHPLLDEIKSSEADLDDVTSTASNIPQPFTSLELLGRESSSVIKKSHDVKDINDDNDNNNVVYVDDSNINENEEEDDDNIAMCPLPKENSNYWQTVKSSHGRRSIFSHASLSIPMSFKGFMGHDSIVTSTTTPATATGLASASASAATLSTPMMTSSSLSSREFPTLK
eukprot:gene696-1334_t